MTLESAVLAQKALQRSTEHQLDILGTITHYWSYPSSNKSAKQIILIHGYRGNHHGLEAIAGALDDFEVIIPDLPGFGRSTPFTGEHTIERYAQWLATFIEKLSLKQKPILLGHSFGSIICAAFASQSQSQSQRQPQPIKLLILENPVSAPALKGPNKPVTKVAQAFLKLAGALPLKPGEWLLKSWPMVRGMSILMTKTRNSELRKWIHAQHDANFNDFANRRVVIEGYTASISHNVADYAADFKVPTLLIIGSRDDITSPKQQLAMAAKIQLPHSISQHAGVGHLTHYEIPNQVAEDIRRFVAQHAKVSK